MLKLISRYPGCHGLRRPILVDCCGFPVGGAPPHRTLPAWSSRECVGWHCWSLSVSSATQHYSESFVGEVIELCPVTGKKVTRYILFNNYLFVLGCAWFHVWSKWYSTCMVCWFQHLLVYKLCKFVL